MGVRGDSGERACSLFPVPYGTTRTRTHPTQSEGVKQERVLAGPCPVSGSLLEQGAMHSSAQPAPARTREEHAGLRECLEQYPCYLADEDMFVPLHPQDSAEAQVIHEKHSAYPHMPAVPRLPRYLRQELAMSLQDCHIYIHAGKWVGVGEVGVVLVVSGPQEGLLNECRLICRSTCPGAPILLNHVIGAGRGVVRCRVLETRAHGARMLELMYRWAGQRWFTPYRALARTEQEASAFLDAIQLAQDLVPERARVWRAHVQRKADEVAAAEAAAAAAGLVDQAVATTTTTGEEVQPVPPVNPTTLAAHGRLHTAVSSVASALTLQGVEEEEAAAVAAGASTEAPAPDAKAHQQRPPEAARSTQPHFQRPLPHQLEAVREENRLLSEALAVEIVRHGQLLDACGTGRPVAW